MKNDYRKQYQSSFRDTYDFLKNNGFPDAFERTQEMVESKLLIENKDIKKMDLESLALEMFEKYESSFTIPKTVAMRGKGCINWFGETNPSYRYYWPRYKRYLEEYKK